MRSGVIYIIPLLRHATMTAKGSTQHEWTDKDDDFVRAKISDGYSYGQIADLLKASGVLVSRNAVIGRAMRKGLGTSKTKPGWQPRKPDPAKVVRISTRKLVAKANPTAPVQILPFQPPGLFETQVLVPEIEQCRWIDGDVRRGTASFCPAAHIAGSSYCLAHHKRVWVPVPEREKRRPMSSGFFRLPPMKANKK